ncbi:MAG TPA: hypothetical protein VJ725_34095, partial [Thermoanaerobaculia bacterium]|nr:hypothetical protein [Thermoanaerobaculia bacterium]
RFTLEDGLVRSLEFDASTDERGTTAGKMTFTDESRIPDAEDPEDPRAGDPLPSFAMTASLDQMTIEKNRALLSGTIVESTHKSYVGKWVQLVVEDNAENPRLPDRLVWKVCTPVPKGWVPSDAERKDDDGAYLHWWATDLERKDDVGIPSVDLLAGEKSCSVLPLSAYAFADVQKWDGDIIVRP